MLGKGVLYEEDTCEEGALGERCAVKRVRCEEGMKRLCWEEGVLGGGCAGRRVSGVGICNFHFCVSSNCKSTDVVG